MRSTAMALLWLLVAAFALNAPLLHAQAWTPMAGHGAVTFGGQYSRIQKHLFSVDLTGYVDPSSYVGGPDNQFYLGDVVGETGTVAADYGVWRGLAVSAQAAYVASRYKGLTPESELDNGKFHSGLQDLILGARYRLPVAVMALTPFLTYRRPLSDYSTLGHSSLGSGLEETTLGIAAGRTLDPALPEFAVQASYAHDFVSGLHGFSLDRNLYSLNGAFFLTPKITLTGGFSYSEAVDGLDWYWMEATMEAFLDHDVASNSLVRLGSVGASWAGNRGFGFGADYQWTISGSNTHAAQSLTLSVSRNFSTVRN